MGSRLSEATSWKRDLLATRTFGKSSSTDLDHEPLGVRILDHQLEALVPDRVKVVRDNLALLHPAGDGPHKEDRKGVRLSYEVRVLQIPCLDQLHI
jgi:hypothetical protein